MNRIGMCDPNARLGWMLVAACALEIGAILPAGAETITWSNTAGGNWNSAANWSPADVPNEAGEEALIPSDAAAYTITLNVSPSLDAVAVRNPAATLNLAGYTLALLQPAGLTNAGLIQANTGSAVISGSVFNQSGGRIQTLNNCNLYFPGPLVSNDGTITVNIDAGTLNSNLIASGNVSLEGDGILRMVTAGQINDAELETGTGFVLTQQAGHAIRGAGTINAALTNYGTVMADESGHTLTLTTNPKTNHGTLGAAAGCYLNVASCTLTQGPTGQLLGDEGTVRLETGTTIIGGALASSGAGRVATLSGTATLEDVHNTGVFDLLPGYLYLRGTLTTNDGTITLNPEGSTSNAFLTFISNCTLGGSGECVMEAATNNNDANIETAAGITGTNGAGHTIRGAGTISAALTNAGLISADDPLRSLDLTINPKTNQAVMQATNGARLQVIGCAVTQGPGATILADNGTVGLATGALITGGTLTTANGGAFDVYSGTATLSDVTNLGQYGVRGGATTALAGGGVTNQGTITVNSDDSGLNAVLHAANSVLLQGDGTLRLVAFNNQNDAAITTAAGVALTQAAGHSIRGSGQIRGAVVNEGLISADDAPWRLELDTAPKTNRGELRAEAGGVLAITSIAVTQEAGGQIVADNGIVQLAGAALSGGTLATANAGAVRCSGGWSTLSGVANLGTLQIEDGNGITVYGSSFANEGLIEVNYNGAVYNSALRFAENAALTGAGEVRLRTGSNDPSDAALSALNDAQVTIGPDQVVHGSGLLSARLVNQGAILADDPAGELTSTSSSLLNQATMRALGGGDLIVSAGLLTNQATLAAIDTSRIIASGGTLANQGEITASGGSTLLVNGSALLVNEDTIVAGAQGHFDVTQGTVKNYGTVRAEAQGSVWVDYGSYWSEGLTEVLAGGSFWSDRMSASGHYSGTTLTGGTWQVADGGTMRLIDCDVQTLKAGAILIGPGATIYRDNGTADALAHLHHILEGGRLEVRAGRNYGTPGNLTNAFGSLGVGAGCAFTILGQYTQTGNGEIDRGVVCVDGTLCSSAGTLAISSGTLCGSGTILDDVASGGWVKPGALAGSPIGTLTLAGGYTQSADGTLDVQLGGTGPGGSDLLHVDGQAVLAGRLIVRSIEGYTPQVGDRFTILACGSRSGEFAVETGCPGLGLIYETFYLADRVEIEILGDASAAPEPDLSGDPELPGDPGEAGAPGDPGAPGVDGQPATPGAGTSDGHDATGTGALPTEVALTARPLGNGAAALRLALPEPAEVELRIFDLSGRRVAIVAQGPETAGSHEYAWRGASDAGRRMPSGVYLVAARIRTESGTLQRSARVLLVH